MLTQEKVTEYVESAGNFCPYCGSSDLEAGDREFDENVMTMTVNCMSCGNGWDDVFTLTGLFEWGE